MPILQWLDKDKTIKKANQSPYRLLESDPSLSYGDQNSGNMLIQGDNLEALKALLPYYANRVKCIYIDPPYNTGSAFEHYDDNLEHSKWLDMMYPRLELLRELLTEDGIIVTHIDDVEQPYLRVIMDEIFSRKNFVNCIAVQDSHPSGLKLSSKEKKIIKTKTYMVVYKKSDTMKIKPIYKKRHEWDTHFNIYMDVDSKYLKKELLKTVIMKYGVVDENFKLDKQSLLNQKFKDFCFKNRNKIFQSTKELPDEAKQLSLKIKDIPYEYISGGERNFALNGRRMSPLSKSLYNIGIDGEDKEDFAKLLCDFWDDVDFNNSQNEGGIQFPNSKKPEYLIARIITMFSSENDLILDSFLGSGTTAAVAHKMNRRWIGIEMGEHAKTHCAARLQKVIDGEQGGISKNVNWQGGGGFRFYHLGETIFDKDGCINKNIKFEHLAAHIWFSETKTPITDKERSPLIGIYNKTAYYLLYNGILGDKSVSGGNVLTTKTLDALPKYNGKKVIYGETTRLSSLRLEENQITFKQTPYDIKAR